MDGTIFYWKNLEGLSGVMCTHVNELCFGGSEWFLSHVIKQLTLKLKVGAEESEHFRYLGMDIVDGGNNVFLDQRRYIQEKLRAPLVLKEKQERVLTSGEYKKYRSVIGQLNWLSQNTRPDLGFAVSKLGRKLVQATNKDMKCLRDEVERIREEDCRY